MNATTMPSPDDFEYVLIAELAELRKTEQSLQKMYLRLRAKPQLRSQFLEQLLDMQHRADRLDAVLNPIGALQFEPSYPTPSSVA